MQTHSQRLENWLGPDAVAKLSFDMRDWYGPPIALHGVPGSVYACGGGGFSGPIKAGSEVSAIERARELLKKSDRARRVLRAIRSRQAGMAGFATLTDLQSEARGGKREEFPFVKTINLGASSNLTSSFWEVGNTPPAGAAGAAAPGGTPHLATNTGAIAFPLADVASDTRHFVGAEVLCDLANSMSLLLYDRLFSVAKLMNSTATEAVTGVPTRYQSTTVTAADHIAGNFLFVEVGASAVLSSTAHNWTVCTYTDQANAGSTLPSVVGNSAAIRCRLDMPTYQWFAFLEPGDTGVKALTQMQCSAAVAAGTINFVIGHPIAWLACPFAGLVCIVDGINTAFNLTRVFDTACLALLEVNRTGSTTALYRGSFTLVHG